MGVGRQLSERDGDAAMADVFQLVLTGLALGGIYALIAIGFVTIFKVSGVINFAQGDFAMVGALTLALLLSFGMPLPFAILLTALFSALFGGGIYRVVLDRLQAQGETVQIILTIGLSMILQALGHLVIGSQPQAVPPFLSGDPLQVLGASISRQYLVIMGVAGFLLASLFFFFEKSYAGIALRAVMMNRDVSRLMGISARVTSTMSFMIGAAVAGVAGVVIAPVTLVSYDMGLILGLKGFVAAVVGGLVDFRGAVAGAVLLGVLESVGAGMISSAYKDAFAFLILILILLWRPYGLFGKSAQRV